MKKRSRKLISILLTLAMLATLLVPMAAPAAAGSKAISSLNVVTTKDDTTSNLGDLLITTVAGAVKTGHTVTLRLPADYKWDATILAASGLASVDGFVYTPGGGANGQAITNLLSAPSTYGNAPNAFAEAVFGAKLLTDNELQIKLISGVAGNLAANDGYLYVYTKGIKIPAGASGEIKVVATAPGSQGFPSGEAVVGKVVGGEVLVSVDEVKTFTDTSSAITLRFKETVAKSFKASDKSMKLRLPNGFEWNSVGTPTMIWGEQAWIDSIVKFQIDGRDLYIKASRQTGGGTYFSLPVYITVGDESVAKYGDIKVNFSGDTTSIPTELVIAKYNEMGSSVSAINGTTVVAGKTEQEIGDIVITEAAPGSLTKDRTVTFTLPSFAKWSKLPTVDGEKSLNLQEVSFVGSDGRTLKYKVSSISTSEAGKVTLKDAEIILSADASGKVKVDVSGTAGVKGTVDVATVVAPVTAKAASAPEVKIGMNGQTAGEFTITELKAGAIAKKTLEVHLSNGAQWNDVPKVEVTEGDISFNEATTSGNVLYLPVKADSAKASTIKISNIKIDVDRTVAEGDISAKVKGAAVNEVNTDEALRDAGYTGTGSDYKLYVNGIEQVAFSGTPFPNVGTAASAVVAKVVTPAPFEQKKAATFKIGDTKFKMGGVEVTMDVAPYVKDGRTYLPVRYVAQALGVSDSNILWDAATQKVTLIKGDKVVQLTIGSNAMLVNGVTITMDVPAEITGGRTMLPFRFIAQAFGATVGWDGATQTVTMEL